MRYVDSGRAGARRAESSGPQRRRDTAGGIRVPVWLHALLLALAPVLVFGFYSVVDGAVDRAAARRAAPPPARAAAMPLKPVVWECSAQRGAGVHNACRPVPAVDFRGDGGRVPTAKS